MVKKISILIASFVTSFWFWFVVKTWAQSSDKFSLFSAWFWPLLLLVILVAIVALSYILLREFKWQWSVAWLVGLTYLLVLGFTWINLIALGVIVVVSLYAIYAANSELKDRVKLHPIFTMRRTMPAVVIPILIAVSFGYYQINLERIQDRIASREVPTTFRQTITRLAYDLLDADPKQVIDEEDEVVDEEKDTVTDSIVSWISGLIPSEIWNEESIAELTREAKRSLIDEAFDLVSEKGFDLLDRYGRYLPPVIAFGLFLVLWGLSFIFVYAGLLVAWLIFKLLKVTGFVKIETVEVPAERIDL